MTGEQREFFRKIKTAIVSNPFSRERELVDRELAGVSGYGPVDDDVLEALLSRVSSSLRSIKKKEGPR